MLYKGGHMPPRTKITKDMIIDAGFEIIREKGHEQLSARAIGDHLHCSTQPVLYSFKTVDEIREAVYQKADAYHSEYIAPKETDKDPMLALGLNYVRFGHEEKNLFRFLFQTDQFGGMDIKTLMKNPDLDFIISIMAKEMECDKKTARERFLNFFCLVHGLASLMANNSMKYDKKQCQKMLEQMFLALTAKG